MMTCRQEKGCIKKCNPFFIKPFIGIVVKEKKLIPVSQWFYLGSIHSLITAMNGKLLIAGTGDGCIHLFETKTFKRIGVLSGHTGSVISLVMDKTNRLFSGSDDTTIREWDTNTGKCVRILKGHESYVISLVISVDNKTLYSGSYDNTVIAWDIATGKRKATFVHMDGGMWLCYLPDGRFAGHPKAVRYLSYRDPETGKVYNAEDLADRFYRPKEVAEALK